MTAKPDLIIQNNTQNYAVRVSAPNGCYRLIDSGGGRKLERFENILIDRPEPQAMWAQRLAPEKWEQADAIFMGEDDDDREGRWKFKNKSFETWGTSYKGVKFLGRTTAFRHVGFFPEQASHWDWMQEKIKTFDTPRVLNLFGYTGVASLMAAKVGASVTHLDASKKAVNWAKDNAEYAGLDHAPIRWITEDARSFVAREKRRDKIYDIILVDPPKFGRGTEGEVWDLFEDLPNFLHRCKGILNPDKGVLMLTVYAVRASFIAFDQLCRDIFPDAKITSGELIIEEEGTGRMLPTSHYSFIEMP